MEQNSEFQIKNLGKDFFYSYPVVKKNRKSLKMKLLIVFSFAINLAIFPILLYALTTHNLKVESKINTTEISRTTNPIIKTPEKQNNKLESPQVVETQVQRNDSYWKISKRICGSGRLYLSIRDQNGGKPLFFGETVLVNCNIN